MDHAQDACRRAARRIGPRQQTGSEIKILALRWPRDRVQRHRQQQKCTRADRISCTLHHGSALTHRIGRTRSGMNCAVYPAEQRRDPGDNALLERHIYPRQATTTL